MAYILDTTKRTGTEGVAAESVTFEEWFTADDALQAGDYIMVCASNQVGASALTLTSATGSWERLDNIDTPRVSTLMRSQIWWHKYDGITMPSAPTAGGGSTAAWAAFAWVVRDAPSVSDQSWIDVNARVDEGSAVRIHTIGSVTTTEDDCLLLTVFTAASSAAFEIPYDFWGVDLSVGRAGDNINTSSPIQRISVASRAQYTAGATPTYDYVQGVSNGARTQHWTIAIKNKTGGVKPVGIQNPPTRIFDYFEDNTFTDASLLTDISTIHPTIDGQSTYALGSIANIVTVNGVINNNPPIMDWFRRINITPTISTIGIFGVRWDLPSATDYTTGLWCLFFQRNSTNQDSATGVYHYFEDSSGNWSVYQFLNRVEGTPYNTIVRYLPDEIRVDGSVTQPDLTDITKRGFAYHQTYSTAVSRSFHFRAECIQPFNTPLTLTGGGPDYPITARRVARMLTSGAAWNLALIQGQGQQVITMPYQLGDGTIATYADDEAQALEYPRVGGVIGYTVLANRQEIRIKASAADTINLSSGIKGTTREQDIVVDPSSSTSATYGFAGTFLGWNVTGKTGISMAGATWIDCAKLDGKGGNYDSCTFRSSIATDAALRLEDGGSASGASFTKGAETYAIEVAGTGTVNIAGATFSGYTKPLNILASSGTVIVEIGSDDTEPTYDTAGATVTIQQPATTLTIARPNFIDGTTYVLLNTTQDTELAAGTISGGAGLSLVLASGTDYDTDDTLELRAAYVSGDTAKLPIVESLTAPSTTSVNSAPTTQQAHTVYNSIGIDGSSRTEFSADYSNLEVDIVIAADFFGQNFMAWWVYNEATLNGLRNFIGAYTLLDEGNMRNNTSVLTVRFDNLTTTNIKQIDNVRIFADDLSYPVKNPSTGGGAIDINWRVPVQTITVSGGISPTDAAAIASATWADATAAQVSSDTAAIKERTDNLPDDPASETQVNTRLASASYTSPDNAGIAAIKERTDNLPDDPASSGQVEEAAFL